MEEETVEERVLVDFVVRRIEFLFVGCLAAKIGLSSTVENMVRSTMACMRSNRG